MRTVYTYNANGNVSTKEEFDANEDQASTRITYQYSNHVLIESKFHVRMGANLELAENKR